MSSKKIHIFLILILILQKIYSIPSQTADYVSKSQLSHKLGGGYAVTKQLSNVGFTSEIYDATSGLPTSDANFILGSKDGYVWICGYSGVIRYDGTTFERLPTNTGLTSGRALFEDSKSIGASIFSTGMIVSGVTFLSRLNLIICSSFSSRNILRISKDLLLYGAYGISSPL